MKIITQESDFFFLKKKKKKNIIHYRPYCAQLMTAAYFKLNFYSQVIFVSFSYCVRLLQDIVTPLKLFVNMKKFSINYLNFECY